MREHAGRARIAAAWALALGLAGAGCGPDDAPGDVAVEFVALRVAVGGPFGGELDLTRTDGTLILPLPATATFTAELSSPDLAADALAPRLTDASGTALPEPAARFQNGLWRVSATVSPGQDVRLEAAPTGARPVRAPHLLHLPPPVEAARGAWIRRHYRPDLTVDRHETLVLGDGTWTLGDRQGTWSDEGDRFRFSAGLLADGEARVALHVDARHLAPAFWTGAAEATDLPGTWSRTTRMAAAAGAEPVEQVETLDFGADAWTLARTAGGVTTRESGTWRSEPPTDYLAGEGTFLFLTRTDPPPSDGEEATTVRVSVVRGGRLFLSPWFRDEGAAR